MTKYSVEFLGCKISQTDAETIRSALREAGHAEDTLGDVRVINTCCITAEAERKSRKRVRKLAQDADARVFVTGCAATLNPAVFRDIGDNVTALPGAASMHAAAIASAADQLAELGCKGPAPGRVERHRTRAFVKVQDGCSFGCSYCIVPTVRGDSQSRPLDAVLDDVARRVAAGQREIVLTGVNIGLYRDPESRNSLPTLVRRVADTAGVVRVRISSIEVNHVNRRLIDVMATHPRICPHLHVPLQSGDDAVLQAMHRHYTVERYRKAIAYARERIPQLNLTTDIIVGYPTEHDDSFERTLQFADEMRFTKVHTFPFSPRPGTEAEQDADPVARHVKRARSQRVRDQAHTHAKAYWDSKVGTHDTVIVEALSERHGAVMTQRHEGSVSSVEMRSQQGSNGYTVDYCPVRFTSPPSQSLVGEEVPVRVTASTDRGLDVVAIER